MIEKRRQQKREMEGVQEQFLLKEKELSDLFNFVKANDEEDFRRIGEAHKQWELAQKDIVEAEQSLQLIAGNHHTINQLIKEFESCDPLQLEEEKRKLEKELDGFVQILGKEEQARGAIIERMKYLENNETLGKLLLDERFHQEKLFDSLERWAIFVLVRHFLKQAQNIHEQYRQPRVIQDAHQFIQQITNHRYKLFCSSENQSIYLEDHAHQRKNELQWSTGLADQVYLSIRLGLALEFGRSNEPLPILLDDILVNFDPSRQITTAKIILQLSKENQIFLFSCHPETADIIQKAKTLYNLQTIPVSFYQIKDGMISPNPNLYEEIIFKL